MKKIYWCIQQLDQIGGTEQVSIDLMNHLCDKYEITLVCTSASLTKKVYIIDKKIHVMSLGLPEQTTKFDQYSSIYLRGFHLIRFFRLLNQMTKYYVFKRKRIRRELQSLIDDEDNLMICSSLDNYYFAPQKGRVFFHFHFNAKVYFSFGTRLGLMLCRRPDKYIFLSKSTYDIVCSKNKHIASKALFIYNPIRYEPVLNTDFNNNTIIFVGRFSRQKNPILAIKIAEKMKKDGFDFKLRMFGAGALCDSVKKYVKNNKLENFVEINEPTNNIKDQMLHADILLITSIFEGFVLVKGEAAALSTPCITSDWGDTVKEMIHTGKDGYIINSNNPEEYAKVIEEVFKSPDKLTQMKKDSYEYAKELSYDKIIPIWIELLNN